MAQKPAAPPAPVSLTIGRLADAAGVNIETIRYYQKRELLPVPQTKGAFRYYPVEMVDRIRFIKRSQELGFTLAEIADLLRLDKTRDRKIIRNIASDKLRQIELKIADLTRMQATLQPLVAACHSASTQHPCPIIASLAEGL
jgi:Hg(II)-responsive transcriptional regulator